MKIFLFLAAFGILFPLLPCNAENEGYTITQAESLLTLERHIANPLRISSTDKSVQDSYEAQIEAIRLLGKTQDPSYVPTYIQYLNYPSSVMLAQLSSPQMSESVEDKMRNMRSVWPAFAAIMDTPHSEKVLKEYVLDGKKPLDWRLTVLVVLKFKNIESFNECVRELMNNYPAGSTMTKMVKVLQGPNVEFWGVIDVPSLEKVASRF
jgi:hypothetical protein